MAASTTLAVLPVVFVVRVPATFHPLFGAGMRMLKEFKKRKRRPPAQVFSSAQALAGSAPLR